MTYLQWNKILAEYFFNIDNAGKDVYLYLSKEDIIAIGKRFLSGRPRDEALAKRDYSIIDRLFSDPCLTLRELANSI